MFLRPEFRRRLGLGCALVLGGCTAPPPSGASLGSADAAHSGVETSMTLTATVSLATLNPSVSVADNPSARPAASAASSAVPSGEPSADTESAAGPDAASAQPARPALGAFPFAPTPATQGGTMTFTNVGAPGWWPRRLDREPGDAACNYKDGTDTWGGHCCLAEHTTESEHLAPFDEELTLILKGIDVKQLAIYQPAIYQPESSADGVAWQRISAWDSRTDSAENLWFTQEGTGSAHFPGDLTHNDCVGYLSQSPLLSCGDLDGYACPSDDGVMHRGFSGSKLFVFLASMDFDDDGVAACDGEGAGHAGPWVALVASELVRDGGRKWNGACNCYSRTGSVGDGCGEMNVFEVVLDDNEFSNREFMSTGMRSYQAGHVGGAVCPATCDPATFPGDADVVDACAETAYTRGPELRFEGETDGCPVWRRPAGDRYFLLLLDEAQRSVQVGILHPENISEAARDLLPELPFALARSSIDALLTMRLPE